MKLKHKSTTNAIFWGEVIVWWSRWLAVWRFFKTMPQYDNFSTGSRNH